jgi:hypothetical protein
MTELTRRPDNREGWFVYFGDICVGHIGLRTGVPVSEPQWGWRFLSGLRSRTTDQRNR